MYVYMYVCMYVYSYIYVYIHVCMYVYSYIYVYIHVTHTHTHTHAHTHIHAYIHAQAKKEQGGIASTPASCPCPGTAGSATPKDDAAAGKAVKVKRETQSSDGANATKGAGAGGAVQGVREPVRDKEREHDKQRPGVKTERSFARASDGASLLSAAEKLGAKVRTCILADMHHCVRVCVRMYVHIPTHPSTHPHAHIHRSKTRLTPTRRPLKRARALAAQVVLVGLWLSNLLPSQCRQS